MKWRNRQPQDPYQELLVQVTTATTNFVNNDFSQVQPNDGSIQAGLVGLMRGLAYYPMVNEGAHAVAAGLRSDSRWSESREGIATLRNLTMNTHTLARQVLTAIGYPDSRQGKKLVTLLRQLGTDRAHRDLNKYVINGVLRGVSNAYMQTPGGGFNADLVAQFVGSADLLTARGATATRSENAFPASPQPLRAPMSSSYAGVDKSTLPRPPLDGDSVAGDNKGHTDRNDGRHWRFAYERAIEEVDQNPKQFEDQLIQTLEIKVKPPVVQRIQESPRFNTLTRVVHALEILGLAADTWVERASKWVNFADELKDPAKTMYLTLQDGATNHLDKMRNGTYDIEMALEGRLQDEVALRPYDVSIPALDARLEAGNRRLVREREIGGYGIER